MTTAIALTLILATFAIEITAIVVLIARDGETKKSREAAEWQRIKGMFAEERDDLTGSRTIEQIAAEEVLAIVAEAHVERGGRHRAPDAELSTMERVSEAVAARSTIGARAMAARTGGTPTQEMRLKFDELMTAEFTTTAVVVPIGGHQRHVDAIELEGRAA